jgi:hypothetical protein
MFYLEHLDIVENEVYAKERFLGRFLRGKQIVI